MSQIDLYIFRHGETDWNKNYLFQGHSDIPLNETGKQQALKLAEKIESLKPEVIITSDLIRAVETARIANRSLQVPVFEFDLLRECHLGDTEGQHRDHVIKTHGQDSMDKWHSVKEEHLDFSYPNGESKRTHLERLRLCIENFCRANSHFKRVAVSTHGGSLRRLVHFCEGSPIEPVPMPNCALYYLSLDIKVGRWIFHGPAK